MRTFLISLAVATSALAVAAPASAQYFPQAPAPQGYGYGYNNNYGQVRNLQMRVDNIQRQIERLRERRAISRNEANGLRSESASVEYRLRSAGRYGLNPRERQDIEVRVARLEQHVRHEVRDGNRGYGNNGNNGYGYNGNNGYNNQYAYDRDRDGRDDRYEDDHGTHHD
jgi:hypothetical protein